VTTLPFPDFFVVGAPRCGTTSLCRYLAQHPQICFSRPKEPHYFQQLDGPVDAKQVEVEYLERCFAHRRPEHLRAGEGSVSYLYSPEAIERILALGPDSRFIVNLRNPFDMIRSYHLRMLYLLEEDQQDLATAWSLQEARARGERIPAHSWDPRLLQYAEAGSLGTWFELLQRRVGAERCLPVVFDDLVADPAAVYARVLGFLGLESDGRTEFPRKQRGQAWRHRWLQEILFRPPRALARAAGVRLPGEARPAKKAKQSGSPSAAQRLLRRGGRLAGPLLKRTRQRLVRWNRIDVSPEPLSPELRRELQAVFDPEIRKLSELLGRNLGHWLELRAQASD